MFCTVHDVERLLQVAIPADKIAAVAEAIQEATVAIQNYCQQRIELVTDETITLDCSGGLWLLLPELPVVDVTSVVEDSVALVAGADEDYQLGQHGVLHRVGAYWTEGVQIIEVVYSHGYAVIPEDVVAVCTRAAARRYQAGLRSAEAAGVPGVAATSLGDYSVTFTTEGAEGWLGASGARMLLESEKDVLARYRVVRI